MLTLFIIFVVLFSICAIYSSVKSEKNDWYKFSGIISWLALLTCFITAVIWDDIKSDYMMDGYVLKDNQVEMHIKHTIVAGDTIRTDTTYSLVK